jgi:phage terminase Nu1 subunit (DNA packaging protein)
MASTAGIPDVRVANKGQLAQFFGVSIITVNNWVRRGCPVVEQGGQKAQWKFDILEVMKWKYVPESLSNDPEEMAPKERLDWYRGDREKTKHLLETGSLVPVARFEAEMAGMLKTIAMMIDSLPDILERDAGISGDAVVRAQKACDSAREDLHMKLLELPPQYSTSEVVS